MTQPEDIQETVLTAAQNATLKAAQAELQGMLDALAKQWGEINTLITPHTAFAYGEMMGHISVAMSMIGRDIEQVREASE